MRIAIVGGGPGGLYFAALAARLDPSCEITVWERNAADDTFGFGVVFSDETLGGIEHADPEIHAAMQREFARWDDIDIHYTPGGNRSHTPPPPEVLTSGGHGFAALSRQLLLKILQHRCDALGVRMHFRAEAPPPEVLADGHDLVVAADGANSTVRARYADTFRPDLDRRHCRYMWLGTDRVFEAFTFYIEHTPYGVMQLHCYPYDATGSTFIVEMAESAWRAAGFDASEDHAFAPGENDEESIKKIGELFPHVLDGHTIMANNSRWLRFATVRNQTWRHGNVVLLGDAAHTAHFSIGSGTKLAMEDALALAACLHEQDGVNAALAAYEDERRPVVESTQRAAQASLEWFESLDRYTHQHPVRFAINLLTRSRRVTYDNLRLRDPEFVDRADSWFAEHEVARGVAAAPAKPRPPMFQPFRLRELELKNRVIVSPMDMYCARDGEPTDFHLVHLGGKALGGAALVMTEMVCVSPTGRITPGCTGLYTDAQRDKYRRIVEFVHAETSAAIGVQLGHSGRKGSTKLMWEGIDQPLPEGNWPVVGPSPVPYSAVNQVPRELTRADLAAIRDEFVAAARRADQAGFDLLELHCAHGYLLSSFISPLTNLRTDTYGGSLDARLRYPLEVFDAIRDVWPPGKPMSVRISATDWYPGGTDADDAVAIAAAFAEHGVDAVDVSTGQVVPDERPAFGRSYQTPYADRIANTVDAATIAVGAISSAEDVNAIILAGRADLVALGRTHLYDPMWTLHAAADQGYAGPGVDWPVPWRAGSRKPQSGRTDGPKPRLELIRGGGGTRHQRWRPSGVSRPATPAESSR